MSDWIHGEPQVATAEDCKLSWRGKRDGKGFACTLCGHRFVAGDYWRFQYTNDIPGAGGNPMVCGRCDGTKEQIVARMKLINAAKKNPALLARRLWEAEDRIHELLESGRKGGDA